MRLGEKNLLELLIDFVKKYQKHLIAIFFITIGSLVGYVTYSDYLDRKNCVISQKIIEAINLSDQKNYKEAYDKLLKLEDSVIKKRNILGFKFESKNKQKFLYLCLKYSIERDMKNSNARVTLNEILDNIKSSAPYVYAEFTVENEGFVLLKEFMLGIITKDLYDMGEYELASKIHLDKYAQQNPNHILVTFKALSLNKLGKKQEAIDFLSSHIMHGDVQYCKVLLDILSGSK